MDILEIMKSRHSVRQYTDKKIENDKRNVLDELAKLPYRERAKFYKEHEDVISKALSKRG